MDISKEDSNNIIQTWKIAKKVLMKNVRKTYNDEMKQKKANLRQAFEEIDNNNEQTEYNLHRREKIQNPIFNKDLHESLEKVRLLMEIKAELTCCRFKKVANTILNEHQIKTK